MSSLDQIAACVRPKPLAEPVRVYRKLDTYEQILVEFDQNVGILLKENVFENVAWNMVAFLFRAQCAKQGNNWKSCEGLVDHETVW